MKSGTDVADTPARAVPIPRDGAVLRVTRAVAAGLLPFLVIAAFLLFVFPTRTGELFAWPIDPPLSAYLLASAYVGGVWFFSRVVLTANWHRVQHGFPAVIVFAAALLAATLLHIDKFSANGSFAVWLALYATTPFVVAGLAVLQHRSARRGPHVADFVIPRPVALGLAGIGGIALVFGVIVFLAPDFASSFWAWDLTPLTARVTGAVLSLTGVVNAALLWDRRWSAFRILFQSQLVSLAAIAVSLAVRSADLHWDRPMTTVLLALVGSALLAYGSFTAWAQWQTRKSAPESERAEQRED